MGKILLADRVNNYEKKLYNILNLCEISNVTHYNIKK